MNKPRIYVGCAGWSIGRDFADGFSGEGTHLQRYAGRLTGVEISSSFYRPHRRATYERWAQSVPEDFRFSVKMPKVITHQLRLAGCETELETFLDQCAGLGDRLGCLLVQLPPSLAYDEAVAQRFFMALREQCVTPVVLEPRHESWCSAQPLLISHQVSQAAVDPSRISTDRTPAGTPRYWRLHGSPRIYHSPYDLPYLESLAVQLTTQQAESTWCIFDNTASGAAMANALTLLSLLDTHL
ncbi:DUF72 domain-containing protein [Pseudomonas sp. S2_E01]